MPSLRPALTRRLVSRARRLVNYLRGAVKGHPGVRFGRDVKLLGPGTFVLERGVNLTDGVRIWVGEGATFTMKSGSKIGDRSIVNVAASVTLEAGTRVSWDVQILDTDFHWIEDAEGRRRDHTVPVVIGPRALVGASSMILKGVSVGEGAIVGAGSVVRRSVPPGAIVAGNPAQQVGSAGAWGSTMG